MVFILETVVVSDNAAALWLVFVYFACFLGENGSGTIVKINNLFVFKLQELVMQHTVEHAPPARKEYSNKCP